MNPNFDEVGKAFVKHYYETFDTNRAGLHPLYEVSASMLTFEGQQFQGAQSIHAKLSELPFEKVQHAITTVDCQPTMDGGVLVFVIGQLKTDNDPLHGFSQMFNLKPVNNSFVVVNDIFRLMLHHS